MEWLNNLKESTTFKRFFILIIFMLTIVIVAQGLGVVFGQKGKRNEEPLIEYFILNYANDEWENVYKTLLLPEDEQYITQEIFVEKQIERYPQEIKNTHTIDEYTYESKRSEDDKTIKVTARYSKNGHDEGVEFEIITDEQGEYYISPKLFMISNYQINIPNNTDLVLHNKRVEERYRIETLPEQQKYEVPLFKGNYLITLKNEYAQPRLETLSVGELNEEGSEKIVYQIERFELREDDQKAVSMSIKTFLSCFFFGIRDDKPFELTIYSYDGLQEKIEEQQLLYEGKNYYKFGASEFLIENLSVNNKGIASCDVNFNLVTQEIHNSEEMTIPLKWQIKLKKEDENWLISDIQF